MGLTKKQLTILAVVMFVVFDVGAYFLIKNTIEGHARNTLTTIAANNSDIKMSYGGITSYPITKTLSLSDVRVVSADADVAMTIDTIDIKRFSSNPGEPMTADHLNMENLTLTIKGEPLASAESTQVEKPVWSERPPYRLLSADEISIDGAIIEGEEKPNRIIIPAIAADTGERSLDRIENEKAAEKLIPAPVVEALFSRN